MPYTIKPGSFKYKKSNGQFSEIDCFEGPDLTEEVAALEKGKAPIIIDSATGNPIAIKDGADGLPVEGMKIHFNPVQDLHGYDSPWPTGCGKNKLPVDIDVAEGLNPGFTRNGNALSRNGVDFTFNDDGTIKVNGTATGNYSYLTLCEATFLSDSPSGTYVLNGCPSGGAASKYNIDVAGASGCDTGNGISLTYTGTLANVAVRIRVTENTTVNNLIFKPMIRLASVTDDTFAPYSNICPISGWTKLTAWRTWKNLLDTSYLPYGTYNGVTFTHNNDGSIVLTGQASATINLYDPNKTFVLKPGIYTISGSIQGNQVYVRNADASFIMESVNGNTHTYTVTEEQIVHIRIRVGNGDTVNGVVKPQLELGETASPYAPYTGQSYPVTFPDGQTVYGGTLDAVNRVLTVEWAGFSKAWADFVNKTDLGDNVRGTVRIESNPSTGGGAGAICNIAKRKFDYTADEVHFYTDGTIVAVFLPEGTSGDTIIQIAYPLATPYEIQLDPITITTLLGGNTIWSDANGDIELNYRADTKLFCQKNDQVNDVQINGASILDAQGVANVPLSNASTPGVAYSSGNYGITVNSNNGEMGIKCAGLARVKAGTNAYDPIVANHQHESVFYGLAKLAGADMSSSSNAVGQFTDDAKSKISDMLNAPVSISGTTPSITGKSGLQYICGEISTLSVVAPSSGCIDIVFKSGSTPTVLTVTSAKANTTIKWANGFDPTALEANTTYEINILDGEFGVVGSWT